MNAILNAFSRKLKTWGWRSYKFEEQIRGDQNATLKEHLNFSDPRVVLGQGNVLDNCKCDRLRWHFLLVVLLRIVQVDRTNIRLSCLSSMLSTFSIKLHKFGQSCGHGKQNVTTPEHSVLIEIHPILIVIASCVQVGVLKHQNSHSYFRFWRQKEGQNQFHSYAINTELFTIKLSIIWSFGGKLPPRRICVMSIYGLQTNKNLNQQREPEPVQIKYNII